MSQNINYIRNELQGFIEVDSVFDIKKGDLVKYITLDEDTDEEYFYKGGKYIKMGDNKMYIDSGNVSSVILKHINSDGSLIYKTRLFIQNDENKVNIEDIKEYEKIIQNLQTIIEKLSTQNNKLKEHLIELNERNTQYEDVIKQLVDTENN